MPVVHISTSRTQLAMTLSGPTTKNGPGSGSSSPRTARSSARRAATTCARDSAPCCVVTTGRPAPLTQCQAVNTRSGANRLPAHNESAWEIHTTVSTMETSAARSLRARPPRQHPPTRRSVSPHASRRCRRGPPPKRLGTRRPPPRHQASEDPYCRQEWVPQSRMCLPTN